MYTKNESIFHCMEYIKTRFPKLSTHVLWGWGLRERVFFQTTFIKNKSILTRHGPRAGNFKNQD